MRKNKNTNNFDEIQALIRKEEEEAFRIFRGSDFDSRLKERIHTETKKKTPFIHWMREPIFILGAALLIVIAGVIMAMSIFFSSQEKSGINAIEQYFQNAPGIQSLMKSEEEKESHGPSLKDKGRKADFLGEEIERVYLSVPKARQSLVAGTALIWDEKTLPRFDLRQKIEILIKEQKLHDFLTKYLKKNEEEENGPKNFSLGFSVLFLHELISS